MWTLRVSVVKTSLRASARTTNSSRHSRRGLTDGRSSGGGRGGGGRSNNNRGGRGSGAFEKFREAAAAARNNKNKPRQEREPGFAERFLDPAARGELKKHQSGIPKLAARRPKSKTAHDEFPGKEAQQILADSLNDDDDEDGGTFEENATLAASLPEGVEYDDSNNEDDDEWETVPGGFALRADPDAENREIFERHYFDVNPNYDPDEEYDDIEASDIEDDPDITVDEDGVYTVGYSSDIDGYGTDPEDSDYEYVSDSDEDEDNSPMVKPRGRRAGVNVDPLETVHWPSVMDFEGHSADDVPASLANQVRPLKEHGPGLDDFVEAMYLHPTKFAEIRRYNLPYESRREPVPDIPRMRKNPPFEWVKSHKKFIYASGFPPFMEGRGDFDNPLHRLEFAAGIASLLEVSPEQVYPANMTSAFVGWKDRYVEPEVAKKIQKKLVTEISFTSPIVISKYDGEEEWGEFTKESPETIVQLKNMPPRMTAARLALELFPADTDLGNMYGPLDLEQILITSPTSALVRFDSADKVEMAMASDAVQERLEEMGEYPIQYFLAKRDLVPAGFTGPNRGNEARRWGQRLIVDGDVPSDAFFRSHAGCVLMRNVDDGVTEKDIAEFLKPYSANLRDVKGSVEWVRCWQGNRTGRAFVGFDRLGEAEAFVKAMNGRVKGLGDSPVVTKVIKDKKIPGAKTREARPDRTEEELLESLNNWEQYVDPKEIEELEQLGVNRLALDLAFRALRFQNSTYGPMDGALRSETLVPEREAGEEYRETVREYIATIKECMGSPEDPGEIYKGFFMPGETIDLSIFDDEKRRQARIHKRLRG